MKSDKQTEIYTAYDDFEQFDPSRPERDLLLAVLTSAIGDLNQPGDVGRKAKEFFLNKDQDYLFSFQSICGFLNLATGQVLMIAGLKQRCDNIGNSKNLRGEEPLTTQK